MLTKTKKQLINPSECKKINYNSRKFKKDLENLVEKQKELEQFKQIDSSKMHLSFQPIIMSVYSKLTFFYLARECVKNIPQYFINLYQKF